MGNSPTWRPTPVPDICMIFLCSTEKKFKTFKILFSTRLIRESDNFLHIILFSIHFFERTPLKHVEKKHGFDLWRVTVATHKHPPYLTHTRSLSLNILYCGCNPRRLTVQCCGRGLRTGTPRWLAGSVTWFYRSRGPSTFIDILDMQCL